MRQDRIALEGFLSILTDEEVDRAKRFRFEIDRNRFVTTRGKLRILLSHYLDIEPKSIKIRERRYGKLFVEESDFFFNLSHSNEVAIIAFTSVGEIGIDIEWTKRKVEVENIARRFFSMSEYQQLTALPKSQREEAFYRIWTRKEAFIKAVGDGLSFPLDQFEVSIDEVAELSRTYWDPNAKNLWSMKSLSLPKGYVGAFVVRGRFEELRFSALTV